MTSLDEIGTPTLGYARESYAREKHPDEPDLIELRRRGFDRMIAKVRAEALNQAASLAFKRSGGYETGIDILALIADQEPVGSEPELEAGT